MNVVAFLAYYHTPDCAASGRPYALASALRRRHRTTVVTSLTHDYRRLTYEHPWAPPDVDLRTLDVDYANRMSVPRRLWAYLGYAARAFMAGLRLDPPPDVVIGSSTPLTAACVAALVARRWGVPWIFEVRDLWPDFPVQMGVVPPGPPRRLLYRIEHSLYRDAAQVVGLSPDIAAHVRQHVDDADKVHCIHYGTEPCIPGIDNIPEELQDEDRSLIVYAGSFGRANAVSTLLDAARACRRHDVLFVFTGDGYYRPRLEHAARQHDHLVVLPPQPRQAALALLRRAAVSIVSFANLPVLAANAPAKLSDSLGCGTPVIVTNPGWTRRLVEEHECGWYVPAEDTRALVRCLHGVLDRPDLVRNASDNATRTARHYFDRETTVERWLGVVEGATASRSARP